MLTVFVFDERESRQAEGMQAALEGLGESALLWLALRDPTEDEVTAVQEVFEFSMSRHRGCSSSQPARLWWTQASIYM